MSTSTLFYAIAFAGAPLLLVVEQAIARRRRMHIHDPRETADSLAQLALEAALNLALGVNVFAAYAWLTGKVGLVTWSPRSPLTWVVAFVVLDFVYYWGHRACHALAPLWALHAVHHQPRAMNLSVGLRGPVLAVVQVAPFLAPLAVVGVPVAVMFPLYVLHTAYKLLVHTRVVGTLGVVERILVTPSQHRVHHASNPRWQGKNFGGVFVLWDRLFGTFQREDEAPMASAGVGFAPIANNVAPWRSLGRALLRR